MIAPATQRSNPRSSQSRGYLLFAQLEGQIERNPSYQATAEELQAAARIAKAAVYTLAGFSTDSGSVQTAALIADCIDRMPMPLKQIGGAN